MGAPSEAVPGKGDSLGNSALAVNPDYFGIVWITNNVPYIEELENGSSSKAPEGMLAVTFAELERGL